MFGGCHHAEGVVGAAIVAGTTFFWRWFKSLVVSTHSSVGFVYEDGYREIFEAREGKSWQGPIPASKVIAWQRRNPKKRRFTMYDIPLYLIDAEDCLSKRRQCEAMLKVWTYSLKQLPRMGIRKYLRFLPMKTSPNAVVCSEAATVILDPDAGVLRATGKRTADRVTPFAFERAMKHITAPPHHPPTDVSGAYGD